MRVMMTAITAEEGQKIGAEHVKRRQAGGDGADPEHPRRVGVSGRQNRILTEEAGKSREPGNCQTGDTKGVERDRHGPAQAAHVPEVLLAAEPMNHAAGAKKKKCFKKRVRHQMKNAG